MKYISIGFSALLAVGCLNQSTCSNKSYEYIDTVRTSVNSVVKKISITHPYYNKKIQHKTRAFYEATAHRILWLNKRKPEKRYDAFIEEVKASSDYGLNPEDYKLSELQREVDAFYNMRKREPEKIASLDMRITATFFLFTTHLLEGRVRQPGAGEFIWKKGAPTENDVQLLESLESVTDLRKELDKLHPNDTQYENLRKALTTYRKLEEKKLPPIPYMKILKPGDSHASIPLIRKRLAETDQNVSAPEGDSLFYDGGLARSVTNFQKSYGLSPDAVIDRQTVNFLNITFKELAEKIALNLERLRWKPHINLKDEQIIVNVPEYVLSVYSNKQKEMEMRVILGSDFNATPIFHDTLKYIVFSPTWTVPKSILREEFLPILKRDPLHYVSQGFVFYKDGVEIDPEEEDWEDKDLNISAYTAVQSPGESNALGHIKFIMPNNFSIYLHDTPADRLFAKEKRALSHGCIRLEEPVKLASYLLRDKKEWDEKSIRKAMYGEAPESVGLSQPVPVHIVYRTAWVDDSGNVNFREDIYGHDERQIKRLKALEDYAAMK